jgi:hypothetical protein
VSASVEELREKLDAALAEVTAAEKTLEGLLRDLQVAPRAEKVTITQIVETAFRRLRTAREQLAKLHELVGAP